MNWYLKVLREYADFSGRARRKEFWMFYLFNFLIMMTLLIFGFFISLLIGMKTMFPVVIGLFILYCLAMFIPTLAVIVRRLHDTNNSGWMYFVSFIPLVGSIWLLVLLCTEGTRGANEYGEDPKEESEIAY